MALPHGNVVRRAAAVTGAAVCCLMASTVAVAAIVPEPSWPAACPIRVGLFLDRSTSLTSGFADVKEASADLVDALRNEPSQVMVAGFGTSTSIALPLTDVSQKEGRRAAKEAISDLTTFDDNSGEGATNWESALKSAESAQLQAVVILTDGAPNASGSPPSNAEPDDDDAPLRAAVAVANRLKRSGTRVVPVGIDLGPGGVENLRAISGPTAGDDYFVTRVDVLRGELYQIAAKSCGVPVSALPTPEPVQFPLAAVIAGIVAGVALLVVGVFIAHRLRSGLPRPSSGPQQSSRGELDRPLRISDVTGTTERPSAPSRPDSGGFPSAPTRGSMSLDFLRRRRDDTPPDQ